MNHFFCSQKRFALMAFILVFCWISACANPVNRRTYKNYYVAGMQAENRGDLKLARKNYSRAWANAKLGHLSDYETALIKYEYGRLRGYLCEHTEAEIFLKEALDLYLKMPPGDRTSGNLSANYLELGRLFYDTDRKKEAVPYFTSGLEIIKKSDFEKSSPIVMAILLEEYAEVLDLSGRNEEAKSAKAEALRIRNAHPGRGPNFVFTRYNQNCPVK